MSRLLFPALLGLTVAGTTVLAQQTEKNKSKSADTTKSSDTTSFPLRLDKAETYVFQVSYGRLTAPGDAGATEKKEDQPATAKTNEKGTIPPSDALTRNIEDFRVEYRLSGADSPSEKEQSISVMIDVSAGRSMGTETDDSSTSPTVRKAESGKSTESERPSESGKADESSNSPDSKGGSKHGILGADHASQKTVTVHVGAAGEITSIDGLAGFREKLGASSGTSHEMIAADEVAAHLNLILGAGIHGKTLEKGTLYSVTGGHSLLSAGSSNGKASGTNSGGRTRTPESNDSSQAGESKPAGSAVDFRTLDNLSYRFEGFSGEGENEIARFNIIAAAGSMDPSIAKTSGVPASGAGEATYRTTDGLVERLNCSLSGGTSAGGSAVRGDSLRIMILRQRDVMAEPPRNDR